MANPVNCPTVGMAGNPACVPVMTNYCRTDDLSQTYTEKWQGDEVTSNCRKYTTLNAGNQPQYVPVVDGYVRRYLLTDANPVTYPQQGSLVYDPRIEDVIEVCQDYPGGCDAVLGQYCAGFAREDLKNNPNLGKLCGCFMSDAEYDKYTGAFGVSKICDPACALQSAVKPRDPQNQFITLKCEQSICVIDDVTISILSKSTVGDINFAQACSSCSEGSGCVCNISDISITAVESAIPNINFSQQCGGLVNCFKRDANGIPQQVECTSLDSGSGGGSSGGGSTTSKISSGLIIGIILAIVAVIIIIIAIAIISRRSNDTSGLNYRGTPGYYTAPPFATPYEPAGFQGVGPLVNSPII